MSFMMKERMESEELKLLRMIKAREGLVDDSRYWNLEKGYQGEMLFDKWFSGLEGEWIVVNDLLLEYAGSLFQIDSFVIGGDRVYLFEVKNFEGDFLFEKDRWYSGSKEIKDPLLQMQRCKTALRQLLRSLGYQLPIESNLIFINPEFNLYNCPPKLPIVFCSQLNRFSTKLLKQSSGAARLNPHHSRLAEKLCELHIEKSPYERLPEYRYEELQKGIVCVGCGGMGVRLERKMIICNECRYEEEYKKSIIRSISELLSLFPEKRITSKIIFEWCNGIVTFRSIQRILINNFALEGFGRSSHYIKI
ncbi:MAG: nuclease-related domain-containing protein [Bacillota bacterium]|nr:nuclease-related domain-containing protein [Bacillota bacterium]